MKEPPLLTAVQRILGSSSRTGGVEVEHDLPLRRSMRLEEEVDEQSFYGDPVMRDLAIVRRRIARQFEPVLRDAMLTSNF
jgi:hypothetical protein